VQERLGHDTIAMIVRCSTSTLSKRGQPWSGFSRSSARRKPKASSREKRNRRVHGSANS